MGEEESGGAGSDLPGVIEAAEAWYRANQGRLVRSGYILECHIGQSEIHEIGMRVAIIDIDYRQRVGRCLVWEVGVLKLEYTPLHEFSWTPDRETIQISGVGDVVAALERLTHLSLAD